MHNTPRQIGDQLRQFLAKSGLTQQALEKKVGIHQSQISRVCRAEFERLTPNIKALCAFAKIELEEKSEERNKSGRILELVDTIAGRSRQRRHLVIKLLTAAALLASVPAAKYSASRRATQLPRRRKSLRRRNPNRR
jgi:transcriptional regulator with XRE-family HTH domain